MPDLTEVVHSSSDEEEVLLALYIAKNKKPRRCRQPKRDFNYLAALDHVLTSVRNTSNNELILNYSNAIFESAMIYSSLFVRRLREEIF